MTTPEGSKDSLVSREQLKPSWEGLLPWRIDPSTGRISRSVSFKYGERIQQDIPLNREGALFAAFSIKPDGTGFAYSLITDIGQDIYSNASADKRTVAQSLRYFNSSEFRGLVAQDIRRVTQWESEPAENKPLISKNLFHLRRFSEWLRSQPIYKGLNDTELVAVFERSMTFDQLKARVAVPYSEPKILQPAECLAEIEQGAVLWFTAHPEKEVFTNLDVADVFGSSQLNLKVIAETMRSNIEVFGGLPPRKGLKGKRLTKEQFSYICSDAWRRLVLGPESQYLQMPSPNSLKFRDIYSQVTSEFMQTNLPRVAELAAAGLPASVMAERLSLPEDLVSALEVVYRSNDKRGSGGRYRLTDGERDKLVKLTVNLQASGKSMATIASLLGIKRENLNHILKNSPSLAPELLSVPQVGDIVATETVAAQTRGGIQEVLSIVAPDGSIVVIPGRSNAMAVVEIFKIFATGERISLNGLADTLVSGGVVNTKGAVNSIITSIVARSLLEPFGYRLDRVTEGGGANRVVYFNLVKVDQKTRSEAIKSEDLFIEEALKEIENPILRRYMESLVNLIPQEGLNYQGLLNVLTKAVPNLTINQANMILSEALERTLPLGDKKGEQERFDWNFTKAESLMIATFMYTYAQMDRGVSSDYNESVAGLVKDDMEESLGESVFTKVLLGAVRDLADPIQSMSEDEQVAMIAPEYLDSLIRTMNQRVSARGGSIWIREVVSTSQLKKEGFAELTAVVLKDIEVFGKVYDDRRKGRGEVPIRRFTDQDLMNGELLGHLRALSAVLKQTNHPHLGSLIAQIRGTIT